MAIDFTTPSGQVRLIIADVDESNLVLSNPMIDGFLALAPNSDVRLAAADALDTIAISEALTLKVMQTLDVTTDGAKLATVLQTKAAQLRKQVSDGVDGGGDFDIANLVLDKHTALEQLVNAFEREDQGWWPFELDGLL